MPSEIEKIKERMKELEEEISLKEKELYQQAYMLLIKLKEKEK